MCSCLLTGAFALVSLLGFTNKNWLATLDVVRSSAIESEMISAIIAEKRRTTLVKSWARREHHGVRGYYPCGEQLEMGTGDLFRIW
jgi:hypothetical protein